MTPAEKEAFDEMLAALIAIREWILLDEPVKADGSFWRKDFAKANNLAHEAIAKATVTSAQRETEQS